MPYLVKNIIEDQGNLTVVKKKDPVSKALSLMLEHDFSQLPVVNDDHKPIAIVTYKTILKAHRNFGAGISELIIANAMKDVEIFDIEDDIFDLLNTLRDTNAVVIVDARGVLTGIVTSFDTTEYFRRRSEDMMIVEDIETIIKDFILAYFTNENDEIDQDALEAAIEKITITADDLKNRYQAALLKYLNISTGDSKAFDPDALEKSFDKLYSAVPERSFEDLSLGEYIALLLDGDRWDFYEPFFKIKPENLRLMLDGVRKTRNFLAHFKGEISADQREQLQFCWNYLDQAQNDFVEKRENALIDEILRQHHEEVEEAEAEESIAPVDEEVTKSTSKYAPLAEWLQGRPGKVDRLRLSFEKIEEIIDDNLPASAYKHRSWWANDTVGHVQSKQWLEAGWRVGYRNMTKKEVTFARIKERERAYIDYFGPLMTRLRQETEIAIKESSPSGTNWIEVIKLPKEGPQRSIIALSFALNSRYRIELYIDTGDKEINKAVFDDLEDEKESIEKSIGQKLEWERINEKRASRIALYNSGSIDDEEEKLKELENWTVEMLPKFHEAIFDRASHALLEHCKDL